MLSNSTLYLFQKRNDRISLGWGKLEWQSKCMAHSKFTVGEINAVIGDNSEHQVHRAGYNGVWELRHRSSTRNLFVPAYAGLNLEHVFNGETEFTNRDIFFEPRRAPMTFKKSATSRRSCTSLSHRIFMWRAPRDSRSAPRGISIWNSAASRTSTCMSAVGLAVSGPVT